MNLSVTDAPSLSGRWQTARPDRSGSPRHAVKVVPRCLACTARLIDKAAGERARVLAVEAEMERRVTAWLQTKGIV